MAALNPRSSVPLYTQLAERLLAQIREGDLKEGERIPSEHELSARYRIGRPTVRQATELLVRRGYLSRRRGAGTFVRPQNKNVDLFSLGGTLESFSRGGVELKTRIASAPELLTTKSARGKSLPLTSERCYRFVRVGAVSGEPVLLERFYLDAEVFSFFDRIKLAGRSLSEQVIEHYKMEATSADQRFFVDFLTAESAALLDLKKGAAVLCVERTLHFPKARAAIFVEIACKSDQFSFTQHIGTDHIGTDHIGIGGAGFSAAGEGIR